MKAKRKTSTAAGRESIPITFNRFMELVPGTAVASLLAFFILFLCLMPLKLEGILFKRPLLTFIVIIPAVFWFLNKYMTQSHTSAQKDVRQTKASAASMRSVATVSSRREEHNGRSPATAAQDNGTKPRNDPIAESFIRAIAEQKEQDPLVGAKIGAKELIERLLRGFKNERGVHIESLLTALGSLAGFSCQMSARATLPVGVHSMGTAFMEVSYNDGTKKYFGDAINKPLAQDRYSIWGLTGGAAQDLGCTTMPDLNELFQYVTQSSGTEKFGIPRVPEKHKAGDLPINYVKALWPALMPVLSKLCNEPQHWPIMYGIAIQEAMHMGKDVINPNLAALIVLECAVPMSKVDPQEIGLNIR